MVILLDPNDPNAWPHQFTKNGQGYELPPDEFGHPRWAQTYICVHCLQEYVQNFQDPPPQPCPARNNKRELKRILS